MSSPDPCGVSPDLGRLLALRRVLLGGVIRFGHDEFTSHGRRVPGYIGYYLVVLLADGHARFGRPQEGTGCRPVLATNEGEILHDDLEYAYRRLRAVQVSWVRSPRRAPAASRRSSSVRR